MTFGGVDYTLRGESLEDWDTWLAGRRDTEWLLTAGMAVNKGAIVVSVPLWMLATIIRLPLSVLSLVTGGLLFWPLHWLIVRPLTFLVVASSRLWAAVPFSRPVLYIAGPLITVTGMTLISLIPDGNPDHLKARLILCELWPLSSRRLEWIAGRGSKL